MPNSLTYSRRDPSFYDSTLLSSLRANQDRAISEDYPTDNIDLNLETMTTRFSNRSISESKRFESQNYRCEECGSLFMMSGASLLGRGEVTYECSDEICQNTVTRDEISRRLT